MSLTGRLIIGSERVPGSATFRATDPARGAEIEPAFAIADATHVDRACALAQRAFDGYRATSLETRARFLETCAEKIIALGDPLLERAGLETGLPRARLEGERGRTVGQLRLFASTVRQGDWLGVRIDPAQPERKPLPRADLRQRKIPLGPVAVFGASNFPLAFSAAGGDTASALAAGCPVIVKAHPSHPGTSELAASAIADAAAACRLPEGTFSHLSGPSNELGATLVRDPRVKAVAFTGSRTGGTALMSLAAARSEPIPVYAEMSSINPVVLLPAALKARAETIGSGFALSLTMGVGQFCTNPGLVLALDGPDLDRFVAAASEALAKIAPGRMLSSNICANYAKGVARLRAHSSIVTIADAGEAGLGAAALFQVPARDFVEQPVLGEEVFGPASLVVRCRDTAELASVIEKLEGQLTATLHLDPRDHEDAARLIAVLERKAGRILVNGWPTGVEVSPAMVHGGPYPATSDSRTTSVGTLAIERFLRPVCYQDMPDGLLAPELRDGNPLALRRMLDGKYASP
ncbi:MAG TPA: aldehyde dehydrogenase (NADP(+)) [Rhizomicrobium sp.]|nr:aldehyde dehydrogenase (NADP(+)) [Rhizomicrobium sp.]